jgi:hypothetical protein
MRNAHRAAAPDPNPHSTFPRLAASREPATATEILFTIVNGFPVALPPGTPDGTTRLSLAQACARCDASAEDMKKLYRAAFAWVTERPL